MVRADENMPEMTPEEVEAMEREFDAYCECVDYDIDPDTMTNEEAHAILRAAGYDPVEVGRRGAAVAALAMLAQFGDDDEAGDDLGVCGDYE